METAGNSGLTTREPEKTFQGMMDAIKVSISDIVTSDDGYDGES
jgi:hypothetical protein